MGSVEKVPASMFFTSPPIDCMHGRDTYRIKNIRKEAYM